MENKFNPATHHRRSIRLKDYDYSQAGAYFVTICAWNRECLFGDVLNGQMVLNENGLIVHREWVRSKTIRPYVELDGFVVMLNHFHGIIVLTDDVGATRRVAHGEMARQRLAPTEWIAGVQSGSLGAIIGQFKSIVTKQINKIRNAPGCAVWQRNYYEHIIRNIDDLEKIRGYIETNPVRWKDDEENPLNSRPPAPDRGYR